MCETEYALRVKLGAVLVAGVTILAVLGVVVATRKRNSQTLYLTPSAPTYTPAVQTKWPLPQATREAIHNGVTHWLDTSAKDGTTVDLFEFDFSVNPHLHLQIYDQDEDDAGRFDNVAHFWNMGVGQAAKRLNAAGRGPVIAAWNGLFFDLNGQNATSLAHHLTPVVLDGAIHYADLPTYRWTFGVQMRDGKPQFHLRHMPNAATLSKDFDYAAGAAQCIVKDGVPLKLEPPPWPGRIAPAHRSASDEAGYIPIVDHIKVSRTSLAWSRDSSHLYLLFVKAPTTETESALAFKHNTFIEGGWTLADVQRFWISKGVWGAINSDGGGPAQLTNLRRDGNYGLIPPRWAADTKRLVFSPAFAGAPVGGSLMYFYVNEK